MSDFNRIPNRLAHLIAEIQDLIAEARRSRPVDGSPDSPLGGTRCYCQGIASSIGGLFMAAFGDAEPDLSHKDCRLEEAAQRIGLDTSELKALQETRQAYEELELRIQRLENRATPEQQRAVVNTIEDLQIHRHTQELFESLLHSHQNSRRRDTPQPGLERF
jgi:hypothetical protein